VGGSNCTSRSIALTRTVTNSADYSGCSYKWITGGWQDPGTSCTPTETQTRSVICRRTQTGQTVRQLLRQRQALAHADSRGLLGLLGIEPHRQLGRVEPLEFIVLDLGDQDPLRHLQGRRPDGSFLGVHQSRSAGHRQRDISAVFGMLLHADLRCLWFMFKWSKNCNHDKL